VITAGQEPGRSGAPARVGSGLDAGLPGQMAASRHAGIVFMYARAFSLAAG
jgi:hypothetical protein